MDNKLKQDPIRIGLEGRIDSGNAAQLEEEFRQKLSGHDGCPVVLDAGALEYISSAGLRILLRIRKKHQELTITDVNPEIYEILEMTGFTEMIKVEKAYRVVSVEGCEVIGEGANGKVYRIDKDNVVKTYKNADALSEIQHEREVARLALILGVPTAISYDVVKVGDSYGSVFELLDAKSFAGILRTEPEKMDWCVSEYVDLLKKVHSTIVPAGKLPDMKQDYMIKVRRMKQALPDDLGEKLERLISEIPDRDTMIHGDYHTKNVVLAGDEVLLIDMDTLATGHPIFDFAQMYCSFVGFGEYDPEITSRFQGVDAGVIREFWMRSLRAYLGTEDEAKVKEVLDKIRAAAYMRLIDWGMRHLDPDSDRDHKSLDLWTSELVKLLPHVDTLDFDVSCAAGPDKGKEELDIDADIDNLQEVLDYVDSHLEPLDCPPKAQMQIDIAVEEIFVNIARYAYAPDHGRAKVRVEVSGDPPRVSITFIDHGVPYDPLAKEDPDVTLPAEDRAIGGLGLFMTKKLMDDIEYEYKDGQNILTLRKNL